MSLNILKKVLSISGERAYKTVGLFDEPSCGGELRELLELYIEGYQSEHTKKKYRGIFKDLAAFIGGYEKLQSLTREQAMRYLREYRKRGGQSSRIPGGSKTVTENTVFVRFQMLRKFYGYLEEQGLIQNNPWKFPISVPDTEPQKRPTQALSSEDVIRLLSYPNLKDKDGIRDKAMLSCLFGAAMRVGELRELLIGQVRPLNAGEVDLYIARAKGGKQAVRRLPEWAARAVMALKLQRQGEGGVDAAALFISYKKGWKGPKVNGSFLYRRFKRLCEKAGLDASQYSPHSGRATTITRMLEKGADPGTIKQVTGHSSVDMVYRYDKRFKRETEEHPVRMVNYD